VQVALRALTPAGRRGRVPVVRVSLAVGAATVVAGAALTLRPFSSLDALTFFIGASLILAGVGDAVAARRDREPPVAYVPGVLLGLGGVLAVVLPAVTVHAVAVVVGIGLVLSGAGRVAKGVRGVTPERAAAIIGGAASIVCGVLALAWPDLSILAVALLVGPVAIVLGLAQVISALRPTRDADRVPRRWLRLGRAAAGLVLALVLAAVSAFLHGGSTSAVDVFYAAPASLPAQPGSLLRHDAWSERVPAGARARRILYTTTGLDGRPQVTSGLVIAPGGARGPVPVILWAHGTTGIEPRCAPSLVGLEAGALFTLPEVLRRRWALVAPDYPGLGAGDRHPYLVGVPAARSALDEVRAARRLPDVRLADRTVVWGHSQGGGAALWVGEQARSYAPDVPLRGVAALAPASDVPALARELQTAAIGRLFATFVVQGYAHAYPDVRVGDYVRPSARTIVRRIVARCLSERTTLASIPPVLTRQTIFARDLRTGSLGRRAAQNVPARPSGVPTLVAQGLADRLVLPDVQARFVAGLCRAGQPVEYRTYRDRDHLALVAADSPLIADLLGWTERRLRGGRARTTCRTIGR
jgi:uncharacterized membrane protein HdeD (DUF308 family)